MFLFVYKPANLSSPGESYLHPTRQDAWTVFETLTVAEFPDFIIEINEINEVRSIPISKFFDDGPCPA